MQIHKSKSKKNLKNRRGYKGIHGRRWRGGEGEKGAGRGRNTKYLRLINREQKKINILANIRWNWSPLVYLRISIEVLERSDRKAERDNGGRKGRGGDEGGWGNEGNLEDTTIVLSLSCDSVLG